MNCIKCGKELEQGARFCPACGTEQLVQSQEPAQEATFEATSEIVEEPKPAKVWSVFSTIGKVLSIVSISTCWIPFLLGLSLGIPGIVFSCLGKKYHTEQTDKNFKIGLILSIIGVVGSLLSYIIYVIVLAVLGLSSSDAFTSLAMAIL